MVGFFHELPRAQDPPLRALPLDHGRQPPCATFPLGPWAYRRRVRRTRPRRFCPEICEKRHRKQSRLVRHHLRRRLSSRRSKHSYLHERHRISLARKQHGLRSPVDRLPRLEASDQSRARRCRPGSPELEREMARPGRPLRMGRALRDYRAEDEPSLSQSPHAPRLRARRPDLRPQYRPDAPGQSPGGPGRPPLPPLARRAGLQQTRDPGYQHRLLHWLHYPGPRSGRPRRRLLPCIHLLCRRREPGNDHQPRLGRPPPPRFRRRASRVLGAHQPYALRRARHGRRPQLLHGLRQVRSNNAARTYPPDARFARPARHASSHARASLRPLLARTVPFLLCGRLPHARLPPRSPFWLRLSLALTVGWERRKGARLSGEICRLLLPQVAPWISKMLWRRRSLARAEGPFTNLKLGPSENVPSRAKQHCNERRDRWIAWSKTNLVVRSWDSLRDRV